ncbi:MAG: DNA methylase [Phyllobacteriaceae bacterium]|nr:DNA methylase [Phyllobacteriaceae bacterium]
MSHFTPRQRLGSIPVLAPTTPLRNVIHHGDCIDVMAQMPDSSVDMILTDPPYICRYRDRQGRTVANDNNDRWLAPAFQEAYRVLKPDSLCISFYGFHVIDRFMASWRAAGFRPVAHVVFVKTYASSQSYFARQHEAAFVLAKGEPPLPAKALPDVQGWQFTGNRLHPTQKPVAPLKRLIETLCPTEGVVLDPFCGSGSTLAAAAQAGRSWIGIELSADHHETASRRMADHAKPL